MKEYEKRYDWLLLEYYEKQYGADRIEVYKNNSPIIPTHVIFSKRGGKLRELPHRETTTLGLFRYLEEGKKYTIKEVKEIIKNLERGEN